MGVPRQSRGISILLVSFEPVGAEAGLDDDGDLEFRQGVFHPVLNDGEYAVFFGQIEVENEFVVDLEEELRLPVFVAARRRRSG